MHTAHSISLVALDDLARLTARATSGACPPSETLKLLQKQAAELMNLALVSAVTAASTTSAHVVSSLPNVGSLLHLARLLLQVRPEAKASSALPVLAGPVGTEDSSSVSFKTNLLNLEKVLSSAVQANKLMNIGNANEDQLKQQNHQHQQIHLEISILQIQEARNRSNITSTSKAAKTMIKTLEMEVIRWGLPSYIFQFLLFKYNVCMQDGDVVGALATLKQGMHESTIHKGNNDMFAVFAILKSQQCLALHDHVSAGDVLDKVESLQEVNSNESGGNGSSSSAGIQCKEIRLLAQILRLVLLSHIGNHTYAMVLIKQIQAGIEAIVALESEQQQQQQQPISSSSSTSTLAPSSSEYTIKSSCYISVPVTATSSPSSSSSNTATTTSTSLRIQLLSTQQFIALICLLTGIVYKPVETTKAKRYLTQGLKSVNRQLFHSNYIPGMTIENVITDRLWFSNTKILLMKQYVEVCLLRCEYDEAFKCLKSLVAYCNEDGSGGGKRWHRYHKEIALLWGLLYQSVHMVKEAEEWLTIAATADSVNSSLSAFEQSVAQKEEDEIRFMANISLMLLTATNQPSPAAERGGGGGGDVASNGKAERALESIIEIFTKKSAASAPPRLHALAETAKGLHGFINGEITKTKSCFLETLKVSDNLGSAQLKYVCLAILGRFFTTTVPQQAEKMLTAAFGQAKKAGHVEFMAACCGLFVSLYKTLCAGHEVEEKGGGGGGGGVGGSSSEKIKEEEETVMNRHKRKLAEYETLQIELDQHAAASLAKGVQLLKEIR